MRAPQPWPCSSETDWRLWRGHLDHVQMPHLATLKREADAEIARIVRYRYGRGKPKRPAPVPERIGMGELVINLKTAKALGLDFPQTLFASADKVID